MYGREWPAPAPSQTGNSDRLTNPRSPPLSPHPPYNIALIVTSVFELSTKVIPMLLFCILPNDVLILNGYEDYY